MVTNPAKYKGLPPDLRAILDKESGVAGAVSFGKAWEAQESFARNLETTKKGLQIITLSDSDVAKMKQLAKPIIDNAVAEQEKLGHHAREFLAEYMK